MRGIRVFSSHDRAAAHHWRNVLEAAGLRAEVRNDLLSSAMGELPPDQCQVEVWLLDERDAALAERTLRAGGVPLEPGASSWRCARCGELAEPQFTQCWRCGATRGEGPPR